VQRGIEPYKGKWAFPGGFLKMDETAEEGALRELKEETDLTVHYIEQFYTFSEPHRDPRERIISIAYYAIVKLQDVKGGDDAANARWFAVDEIPPLAFDHDHILRKALERLRESIHFRPIGFELLPEKFTIKQLQLLYEAILGVQFDRRNFTKKMLHYELIYQLDETTWPTPKREAFLFSFNLNKYNELKQKGFRLEF
jgi:8-oxo-dGTP diphosphatase